MKSLKKQLVLFIFFISIVFSSISGDCDGEVTGTHSELHISGRTVCLVAYYDTCDGRSVYMGSDCVTF